MMSSRNGVGFALKVEELAGIKKNGKRIMKLRDGDALAAVCQLSKSVALFVRSGSGLVIQSDEIPVRDSAAVGVALMGVRKGDAIVGMVSFDTPCKIMATLSSGKEKEISSSEITKGRRALKGTKVISRAEIEAVKKV